MLRICFTSCSTLTFLNKNSRIVELCNTGSSSSSLTCCLDSSGFLTLSLSVFKVKTSRAASKCQAILEPPVLSRRTEDPAETSLSNGSSIPNTAAARVSGTAAATVTTTDSRPRRSARTCASSPRARTLAICRKSPDHARDIIRTGTTTARGNSAVSSSTRDASVTRTGSRPATSVRNSAPLLLTSVS